MELINDEIYLLNAIYVISGSILVVNLLDFTFKWGIKPLCDWISSLFNESEIK